MPFIYELRKNKSLDDVT